jgi:hypothetical protein
MTDVAILDDTNALWHWDGAAWSSLTRPERPLAETSKPPADPVGAWLWHEARYEDAIDGLNGFAAESWSDRAAREALLHDLATLDAEAAVSMVVGVDAATMRHLQELAARP